MMMGVGFSEILLFPVFFGLFGGGILGTPPGERDEALVRAAPGDSLLYVEWASRTSGKEGAPGIEGFVADPEIRAFVARVEQAIVDMIESEVSPEYPDITTVTKSVRELVKLWLRHPGAMYARFDEQAAVDAIAASGELGPGAVALGIRSAIVVNAGDDADVFAGHVKALMALPGAIPADRRKPDLRNQVLPLPIPAAHLELHRDGSYFVLAFGKGVADGVVDRLTGDGSKSLSANERFSAALRHVATKRTATVSWIDVKGLLETIVKAAGFQGQMIQSMAQSTGLDGVDSLVTVTGLVDGRNASRSFLTTDGSLDGLLALGAGRALTAEDLAGVPGDADMVWSVSLDGGKLLAAARDVVGKSDPTGFAVQAMNNTLEQLDEELGFSIEKDGFDAFGDVWIVFDSPAAGGVVLSGLTASLEVRDHEKAAMVYDKVMGLLEGVLPGVQPGRYRRSGAELRTQEFLGQEIKYVTVLDDDVPFAPAFCLTESHLLVAGHPQALKAQLRFEASNEPNFARKFEETFPVVGDGGELLSVGYVDARRAVRLITAFVPYFGASITGAMQSEGFELDAFAIPSARAILPYVEDSFSRCVRTKDGFLFETHDGLPVSGAATMFVQMPMFVIMGRTVTAPRIMVAPAMRARQAAKEREARAKAELLKAKAEAAAKEAEDARTRALAREAAEANEQAKREKRRQLENQRAPRDVRRPSRAESRSTSKSTSP